MGDSTAISTDVVQVEPTTGEEMVVASQHVATLALTNQVYAGLSEKPVNSQQAQDLLRAVGDDEAEVLPNGAVYLSHAQYRRRLNAAFNPGGWGLRPLSAIRYDSTTNVMYREYALYAEGRFLGSAMGECKYHESNGDMTFGDAAEGVKSNALVRCCKDLGMALECWDRAWTDAWREKFCVKVWVKRSDKTKPQWRRLSDAPFWGEAGLVDDSPNSDSYVLPEGGAPSGNQGGQPGGQGKSSSAPKPQGTTSSVKPQGGGNGGGSGAGCISEKQEKRLFAIAAKEDISLSQIKEHIDAEYGIDHTSLILKKDYEAIINWIENGG